MIITDLIAEKNRLKQELSDATRDFTVLLSLAKLVKKSNLEFKYNDELKEFEVKQKTYRKRYDKICQEYRQLIYDDSLVGKVHVIVISDEDIKTENMYQDGHLTVHVVHSITKLANMVGVSLAQLDMSKYSVDDFGRFILERDWYEDLD